MKSATGLLNIGNSGLSAARKRLTTAGHNIANANTEGFSRQRTTQEATRPIGYGDVVLGTGTRISRVERVHDQFLEKKIGHSITDHFFNKERSLQLSQIESIFNEVNISGFNDTLNKFFNSFRELSQQPNNNAIKTVVRDSAKNLVEIFRSTKKNLNELQFLMDKKITQQVSEINSILHQISKLNIKVVEMENQGGETGDLRDQRDLKIRDLSEFFELNVYEHEKGQYSVNAIGLGSLVTGGHVQELAVQKSSDGDSYLPGSVDIYFKERPAYIVSGKISKGKLEAILKTRDNELKSLQKYIDDLAFQLSDSVNSVHRQGVVSSGVKKGSSGINFFHIADKPYGASEILDISNEIKSDLNNIVTALEPNSPDDNRIALAITKVQYEKILNDNTLTFEEFYLEGVAEMASILKEVLIREEHSDGILAQNKALREKISGVSIDEETADVIRFQHAFDASARVMSVADEMFDTVLNIKRI